MNVLLGIDKDTCECLEMNTPKHEAFLIRNLLSELKTEIERKEARKNLGLSENIVPTWGNIQGFIDLQEDLAQLLDHINKYGTRLNITQLPGTSTSDIMSLKAVTDALNDKVSSQEYSEFINGDFKNTSENVSKFQELLNKVNTLALINLKSISALSGSKVDLTELLTMLENLSNLLVSNTTYTNFIQNDFELLRNTVQTLIDSNNLSEETLQVLLELLLYLNDSSDTATQLVAEITNIKNTLNNKQDTLTIAQTLGNSIDAVISQKAVSDALSGIITKNAIVLDLTLSIDSPNLIPSQYATYQAIKASEENLHDYVILKITPNIVSDVSKLETSSANNTRLVLEQFPYYINKNLVITFSADINKASEEITEGGALSGGIRKANASSLTSLDRNVRYEKFENITIGQISAQDGDFIKITKDSVIKTHGDGSNFTESTPIPHGLVFEDFVKVTLNILGNEYTLNLPVYLSIVTKGGNFNINLTNWNPKHFGRIFADCNFNGTNAKLQATCSDFKLPIWIFTDSYGVGENGWTNVLHLLGIYNFLLVSTPNNINSMRQEFLRNLKYGTPKYLLWSCGMLDTENDGELSATYRDALTRLIKDCTDENIKLILTTIPNTPTRDHAIKNDIIKSLTRYIDFAKVVGASELKSNWYDGMLSGDTYTETTKLGAELLASSVLCDFPEIILYGKLD